MKIIPKNDIAIIQSDSVQNQKYSLNSTDITGHSTTKDSFGSIFDGISYDTDTNKAANNIASFIQYTSFIEQLDLPHLFLEIVETIDIFDLQNEEIYVDRIKRSPRSYLGDLGE